MSPSMASRTWSSGRRPPEFTSSLVALPASGGRPMHRVIGAVGVVALVLAAGAAGAQNPLPCDFVTGGGYIITNNAKANFGVGGSCKAGGDGHGLWGHLEYIDKGFSTDTVDKLNVHWTDITGYFFCGLPDCSIFVDPPGQPTGTRLICGTARTNLPSP